MQWTDNLQLRHLPLLQRLYVETSAGVPGHQNGFMIIAQGVQVGVLDAHQSCSRMVGTPSDGRTNQQIDHVGCPPAGDNLADGLSHGARHVRPGGETPATTGTPTGQAQGIHVGKEIPIRGTF